jgi:hypothetical protein
LLHRSTHTSNSMTTTDTAAMPMPTGGASGRSAPGQRGDRVDADPCRGSEERHRDTAQRQSFPSLRDTRPELPNHHLRQVQAARVEQPSPFGAQAPLWTSACLPEARRVVFVNGLPRRWQPALLAAPSPWPALMR